MAERTTQSWTSVPHFFLVRDVDASALNAAREQRGRDKFTHHRFADRLVARALVEASQDERELDRATQFASILPSTSLWRLP